MNRALWKNQTILCKIKMEDKQTCKQKADLRYYHRNKKLVNQCTKAQKCQLRAKWRRQKKKQRLERKKNESINVITSTKTRGRPKVRRDRSKLFRDNIQLAERNKTLNSKNEALRIKNSRIKFNCEKEKNELLLPREKEQKYDALTEAVKKVYKDSNKQSEKAIIKKIIRSDPVKNKRLVKSIHKDIGLSGTPRWKEKENREIKKNRQKIVDFFLRDDVSRACAGKKECKTLNKVKMQKRYLLGTMKDLYKKFSELGFKCSYSVFCRYKPFYVIAPKVNDRDTCLCFTCNNLELKRKTLVKLKVIDNLTNNELVQKIVCKNDLNCMYNICETCKDRNLIPENHESLNVEWYKWLTIDHEYEKKSDKEIITKKTKKVEKVKQNTTLPELIKEYNNDLISFKKHKFNIRHQYEKYRECILNLNEEEVAIHIDFSENWNCKLSEEIQSKHFGASQNQITLHTGIFYTMYNLKSFCTISESKDHGPASIWAHLDPILNYIKATHQKIKVVHFFSDGPVTQYRQKHNFFLFTTRLSQLYNIQHATWNFSEAGHGKGAADGIGAVVKRTLDRKVACGVDIGNIKTAFEILKNNTSLLLYEIKSQQIEEINKTIPSQVLPLIGTMKVHQLIFFGVFGQLRHRVLSCFCEVRKIRGQCECFDAAKFYNCLPTAQKEEIEDKTERRKKIKGSEIGKNKEEMKEKRKEKKEKRKKKKKLVETTKKQEEIKEKSGKGKKRKAAEIGIRQEERQQERPKRTKKTPIKLLN